MEHLPAQGLRVLIFVAPPDERERLRVLVEAVGHRARAVADEHAALVAMRHEPADVVLLDLQAPALLTAPFCKSLRAMASDCWLPIIGLCDEASESKMLRALAAGADECLRRSVTGPLLAAKLRHYQRILALQSRLATLALRQRAIQDNILDAVLTLDEQERVLEANRAACHAFGDGTPAPVVARSLAELTGLDLLRMLQQARPSLRRAEHGQFVAEVKASRWSEGGRHRTTLVIRDLTEQLRNERMRDEFLATVSHELRTPLTSVLGAVGLLAAGAAGPLPASALPLAAAAMRNGERLSKLIDDILDLTKLEGDRMLMHLRPQLLPPLLQDAVAANQGYADRAGVRLSLDAGGIGNTAQEEIRLDADRFLQVMANLLSNGIKHTPKGGTVTVRLMPAKRGLLVRVSDQGPGVDPAFRAMLFEKFSQADTSDRRAMGGTGLGLYIARLMIDRMGGRITAAQTHEKGASFDVWLPFARQPGAESALPPTDFGALEPASPALPAGGFA